MAVVAFSNTLGRVDAAEVVLRGIVPAAMDSANLN
jgi:hypothetical protein